MMKYRDINIAGHQLAWSVQQNSEHPDLIVRCAQGEIWVQVEVGLSDKVQNSLYQQRRSELPLTRATVEKVIFLIVKEGYLESYFNTDIGLIYSEYGYLIEN